jgi:hypothetical protein
MLQQELQVLEDVLLKIKPYLIQVRPIVTVLCAPPGSITPRQSSAKQVHSIPPVIRLNLCGLWARNIFFEK